MEEKQPTIWMKGQYINKKNPACLLVSRESDGIWFNTEKMSSDTVVRTKGKQHLQLFLVKTEGAEAG